MHNVFLVSAGKEKMVEILTTQDLTPQRAFELLKVAAKENKTLNVTITHVKNPKIGENVNAHERYAFCIPREFLGDYNTYASYSRYEDYHVEFKGAESPTPKGWAHKCPYFVKNIFGIFLEISRYA